MLFVEGHSYNIDFGYKIGIKCQKLSAILNLNICQSIGYAGFTLAQLVCMYNFSTWCQNGVMTDLDFRVDLPSKVPSSRVGTTSSHIPFIGIT